VRTRVPDGLTTTLASFSSLSDMACITVSVRRNRDFHHQYSSQFGGPGDPGFRRRRVRVTCLPHRSSSNRTQSSKGT
jgi:hypothetical protein